MKKISIDEMKELTEFEGRACYGCKFFQKNTGQRRMNSSEYGEFFLCRLGQFERMATDIIELPFKCKARNLEIKMTGIYDWKLPDYFEKIKNSYENIKESIYNLYTKYNGQIIEITID